MSPRQLEILREKEMLRLSRTHVLHQLEIADHPRYRRMLRKALHDLDVRLKKLVF